MNRTLFQRFVISRLLLLLVVFATVSNASAQEKEEKIKLSSDAKIARDYSFRILDEMKDILRENYYDSKMHGVDLEKRIETAKTRVKTMQYNWQMYRVLVQVLMDFNTVSGCR